MNLNYTTNIKRAAKINNNFATICQVYFQIILSFDTDVQFFLPRLINQFATNIKCATSTKSQ